MTYDARGSQRHACSDDCRYCESRIAQAEIEREKGADG